MIKSLTVARYTVRELLRRRLVHALLLVTVLVIALTAWGFHSLVGSRGLSGATMIFGVSQVLVLVMFMFSGIVALTAIMVAAGAIAGDMESGVFMAVLARPVTRGQVVFGKWLGVAALVVMYTGVLTSLEFLVVFNLVGYAPPHPVIAAAAIVAESLSLATLALLLSTRMGAMTSGILAATGFFMAWLGGEAGNLAPLLHDATLAQVGTVTRVLLPSDALWRAAVYHLEPALVLSLGKARGAAIAADPFVVLRSPAPVYMVWVGVWFAGVILLAVWSFKKRSV